GVVRVAGRVGIRHVAGVGVRILLHSGRRAGHGDDARTQERDGTHSTPSRILGAAHPTLRRWCAPRCVRYRAASLEVFMVRFALLTTLFLGACATAEVAPCTSERSPTGELVVTCPGANPVVLTD